MRIAALTTVRALAAAAAGLALLSGCGSSTSDISSTAPATTTGRHAGGLGAPDVIAVVCNLTPDVLVTSMTSTKPGKSPARLTTGSCISSRPEDAGGDSQTATAFGDNCGVKATVQFPGTDGAPDTPVKFGFYSINFGFRGVVVNATPTICRSPGSAGVRPKPGQSEVITVGGFPVRVYQWPDGGRYVQIGLYVNPKGTPPAEMQ